VPVTYTPRVFERLRGLQSCDGLPIPSRLALTSDQQLLALDFLTKVCALACLCQSLAAFMFGVLSGIMCTWGHCGVAACMCCGQTVGIHANNCVDVDIRGLNLDHTAFLPVMRALSILPVNTIQLAQGASMAHCRAVLAGNRVQDPAFAHAACTGCLLP
jgi:hypothetical protein